MTARRGVLLLGMWLAWSTFALYVAYVVVLFAGGVALGVPKEPYLAGAEVLTIVGALLQVALFAAIHASSPYDRRIFSLLALGWMVAMAAVTMTVHFVQLTVGRRIDLTTMPDLRYVFGWEWPSLLYGAELAAWHLLFGLSALFVAPVFQGSGRAALVRIGLYATGALCLFGLVGPAVGDLAWRFVGVFGYAFVFPITCLVLGFVFRDTLPSVAGEDRGRGDGADPG